MLTHKGCPAHGICDLLKDKVASGPVLEEALVACESKEHPLCLELLEREVLTAEDLAHIFIDTCSTTRPDAVTAAGILAALASRMSQSVVDRCARVSEVLEPIPSSDVPTP